MHSFTHTSKGSETSIDGNIYEGVVVWFGGGKKGSPSRDSEKPTTKSFGFIEWQKDGVQQRDMFVHFSNIIAPEGTYRTLVKGQKVSFMIGTNNNAEPKAIFVKVIE